MRPIGGAAEAVGMSHQIAEFVRFISVRARLWGIALLCAALIGGLAVAVYFTQQRVESQLDELEHHARPLTTLASDLRAQSLHLRRYEKDLFLNVATPERLAEYTDHWNGAYDAAVHDLDQLDAMVREAEDHTTLDAIRTDLVTYHDAMVRVRAQLGYELTDPASANHAIEPVKPAIRRVEGAIAGFAETVDDRLESAQTQADEEIATYWQRLGISFALAFFAGVFLFVTTVRSITRPVRTISEVLRAARNGDLTKRSHDASRDELGRIATALDGALDQIAAARTELSSQAVAMRRVLDTVEEGMVLVRADGQLEAQRSAAFDRTFGAPADGEDIIALAERLQPGLGGKMEIAWFQLVEGELPREMLVDQMPHEITRDGRIYHLGWVPTVDANDKLVSCLLLVSDITERREGERAREEQQEVIALLQHHLEDPAGVEDFMRDAEGLAGGIDPTTDLVTLKRRLHTLKGNAAVFGLHGLATVVHAIEDELELGEFSVDSTGRIASKMSGTFDRTRRLLGGRDRNQLDVRMDELFDLVDKLVKDPALRARLLEWKHEPLRRMFAPLARDAQRVAEREGKGEVRVVVDDGNVRLPRPPWRTLFSSLTHAVRNAVDHGLETPDERVAAGKSPVGTLRITSAVREGWLTIEIADDGRGVDWAKVAAKASSRGLPSKSHKDLVAALFTDGLSTRDTVSETSGRGVGLAALHEECVRLGGDIDVVSERGVGTKFRFRVPVRRHNGSIAPRAAA